MPAHTLSLLSGIEKVMLEKQADPMQIYIIGKNFLDCKRVGRINHKLQIFYEEHLIFQALKCIFRFKLSSEYTISNTL